MVGYTITKYFLSKRRSPLQLDTGIFPSTFLQLANRSKNSILNWVIKLNLFMCFFFFFLKPWKIFHSINLLFLLFSQVQIKESCMYLSSQRFFKTPHKTIKFQEKCIFQRSADLKFKNFPFRIHNGATPWSHWTKQTVKKHNLWGKKKGCRQKCLDKSLRYEYMNSLKIPSTIDSSNFFGSVGRLLKLQNIYFRNVTQV